MRDYHPLAEKLPGYDGDLAIARDEKYLTELSPKTLRSFLTYIGFKAKEQKFPLFRWPENLDISRVKEVFGAARAPTDYQQLAHSSQAPGQSVVIGGGHGVAWLAEFQKRARYALIQGPDDDGFGALIFPLGVTVPAGDIINSFLAIAAGRRGRP